MEFKVGHRVIHKFDKRKLIIKSSLDEFPATRFGPYYLLKVEAEGLRVALEKDLELDKQWYREQKLKELLKSKHLHRCSKNKSSTW